MLRVPLQASCAVGLFYGEAWCLCSDMSAICMVANRALLCGENSYVGAAAPHVASGVCGTYDWPVTRLRYTLRPSPSCSLLQSAGRPGSGLM